MTRQCEQCELQRVSPRLLRCRWCGHTEPYACRHYWRAFMPPIRDVVVGPVSAVQDVELKAVCDLCGTEYPG